MFACTVQPGSGAMTGVGDAAGAGVRGGASVAVDHADLAHGLARIGGDERGERGVGALARAHALEAERAVGDLGERLRRDTADAGLDPRDDRAGREVVRLHGDPERARLGISRHD